MILDIIVIATLLISAVIAFLRGFIREVLTILGVVGGLAAAYFGGPQLLPLVSNWFDAGTDEHPKKLFDLIPYDILSSVISYGAIFVIVVIVLSIASHLLSGWAKAIGLGAVDRTLGVIFGLARGIIILGLLYLPVHVMIDEKTQNQWFADSKTHFYVSATSDWMMGLLPASFKEDIAKKTEETTQSAAKTTREKLQELDVLGTAIDKKSAAPEPAGPPAPQDNGYRQDQRQDMNELFKDKMND